MFISKIWCQLLGQEYTIFFLKYSIPNWPRELTRWLWALAALVEDWIWFPAPPGHQSGTHTVLWQHIKITFSPLSTFWCVYCGHFFFFFKRELVQTELWLRRQSGRWKWPRGWEVSVVSVLIHWPCLPATPACGLLYLVGTANNLCSYFCCLRRGLFCLSVYSTVLGLRQSWKHGLGFRRFFKLFILWFILS